MERRDLEEIRQEFLEADSRGDDEGAEAAFIAFVECLCDDYKASNIDPETYALSRTYWSKKGLQRRNASL